MLLSLLLSLLLIIFLSSTLGYRFQSTIKKSSLIKYNKFNKFNKFNNNNNNNNNNNIIYSTVNDDTTTIDKIDTSTFTPEELEAYKEFEKDQALIKRISEEVLAESGVELEQLINPSKVVNLERDIINLTIKLETETDLVERQKIEESIDKKRRTLVVEKRSIMQGWLKNLFVYQSILAGGISLAMVYNSIPGIDLPLPYQVLGFWMWWLFIIPSLRARKPTAEEKDALNIAFLLTPIVSLALPSITKDVALIWYANAIATAGCYAYAYLKPKKRYLSDNNDDENDPNATLPPILIKAFKALDYGSGQERGARK
jgi:hypothetical protein